MSRIFLCLLMISLVSCTIEPGAKCEDNDDCLGGQLCFRGFCNEVTGKCVPGETRPCPGPQDSPSKGECKLGVLKCLATESWADKCEGVVKPQAETCDGKDNDCDGKVDNTTTGQALTQTCYSGPKGTAGQGKCKSGTQSCQDGKWTNCQGEVKPDKEVCGNKLDDDCDGKVDNVSQVGQPCTLTASTPECRAGIFICESDGKLVCQVNTQPKSCNGKDDDCNGKVDEGCDCKEGSTRPCGKTDEGACKKGVQRCVNGKWSSQCVGEVGPKAEVCNGIDDNCDGRVDNRPDSPQPLFKVCYRGPAGTQGKGPCKEGRQICLNGVYAKECSGQVVPIPERCANQIDDNCDGLIDNVLDLGVACLDAQRKGRCKGGLYRCWGTQRICLAQAPFYKAPIPEECNGIDDDCDGFVDNAVKGTQAPLFQVCGSDKGLCQKGKKICVGGRWSDVCTGETAPSPEICNQKDDNCNGQNDEGGVCNTCTSGQVRSCFNGPIRSRTIGRCKDGTELCSQSKWSGQCVGAILPKTEDCNGIDDDCDGRVDNLPGRKSALTQSCYDGSTSTDGKGTCSSGIKTCSQGTWSSCSWQVLPKTEICDGKDNNCDGSVDEDFVCFGTSRKLFESCSRDKQALAYEKCAAGLSCLQTGPTSPASFCYQTCKDNTGCANNKDGRDQCFAVEEAKTNICLALPPEGAPCDEQAGFVCGNGTVCDGVTRKCRQPSVAPPLGACSGETRFTCPSGYTCSFPNPSLPHGYCMKTCSGSNPCANNAFCFLTTPTAGVCLPVGTQKQDELCGNPTGDKILASQYCVQGQFCFRPSATNPFGICAPFQANCQCASNRLCLPAPGNVCLSLRKCGTCPGGQVCATYGTTGNACAPAAPAGTVPFGGACSLTHRCLAGLVCFSAPGARVGHCTKVPCKVDAECPTIPAGATCQVVTQNLDKACVFPCTVDNDCPSNFQCDSSLKFCFPK